MKDRGMPSFQLLTNDAVMGGSLTSLHANVKDLNGKPSLGDGNSSPNGVFQPVGEHSIIHKFVASCYWWGLGWVEICGALPHSLHTFATPSSDFE